MDLCPGSDISLLGGAWRKVAVTTKYHFFLGWTTFPLPFFPRMLILPNLISEYFVLYKPQWYFGSKLCTRICIIGWKWLQWASDPTRGKFLCEPVNHFKQNCSPNCWETRDHLCSHVCLCRGWIKSCCHAGWLLYVGIIDCKTARTGTAHLSVHCRSLQNDLGLAPCADVFVFKRYICNKLFSKMLGSVSPCSFFPNKRLLFSVQCLCWSRQSGMGGKGVKEGSRGC